jgi:hypothetical protein
MQKAGVRWAGHLDGNTQQPYPPPVSLLYTVANKEVAQHFGRGHDIVVIWNRRNLRWLLFEHKHLRKSSCAAFCPCPLLQLSCANSACRLLGIAVLTPFCHWGYVNSAYRLYDIAVFMSSSHRLLILHSPQIAIALFLFLGRSLTNFTEYLLAFL